MKKSLPGRRKNNSEQNGSPLNQNLASRQQDPQFFNRILIKRDRILTQVKRSEIF
jgi:hypothetical protein